MQFEDAAKSVKAMSKKPSDDEMLKVYSLYKQATVGDTNTAEPGLTDIKGKAKWGAWKKLKGTSKDAAKAEYVKLVEALLPKYA